MKDIDTTPLREFAGLLAACADADPVVGISRAYALHVVTALKDVCESIEEARETRQRLHRTVATQALQLEVERQHVMTAHDRAETTEALVEQEYAARMDLAERHRALTAQVVAVRALAQARYYSPDSEDGVWPSAIFAALDPVHAPATGEIVGGCKDCPHDLDEPTPAPAEGLCPHGYRPGICQDVM